MLIFSCIAMIHLFIVLGSAAQVKLFGVFSVDSDSQVAVGWRFCEYGMSEADGGVEDRSRTFIHDCWQGEFTVSRVYKSVLCL